MKKVLLFLLVFSFSLNAFAQIEARDFPGVLQQASSLAKKGEWDRSEVLFLKTLESPQVEERIRAYDGLASLYRRLKMPRKTKRVEQKLLTEKQLLERLVPTNKKYYKTHKVEKGDTYGNLASRFKVSQEWLELANKRKVLKEGQSVLIPKLKDRILVDKKKRILIWMRGQEVVKTYRVSIGKAGSETPEGGFKIVNKVENPIWYRLGQVHPPESPDNLLGTRWLGFDHKSYGIHGTRHPNTIGEAASHGCVRMYNHEVEEIFRWIPVGTKVMISSSLTPSRKSA